MSKRHTFHVGFLAKVPQSVAVQAVFSRAQHASVVKISGLVTAWESLADIQATGFSMDSVYLDIYDKLPEQRASFKLDEILQVAHELNDLVLQSQVEIIDVVIRALVSLAVLRRYLYDVSREGGETSAAQAYRILVGSRCLELLQNLRVDVHDFLFPSGCSAQLLPNTGLKPAKTKGAREGIVWDRRAPSVLSGVRPVAKKISTQSLASGPANADEEGK